MGQATAQLTLMKVKKTIIQDGDKPVDISPKILDPLEVILSHSTPL